MLLLFLLIFSIFFLFKECFTMQTCQVSKCRRESPDFGRFLQVSRFVLCFYRYCLPSLLKQSLVWFPNVYSFVVSYFSHYRKYSRGIVESENMELNITISDSGIISILQSFQFTQKG